MTSDIIGFHLVTDPHASFSNWDFSPFTYADYYYTCVEQYMMAQKVFAGHRFDLFEKILRTADPAEMKWLAGKDSFQEYAQIRSFWEKNRKHIVRIEFGVWESLILTHPGKMSRIGTVITFWA